MDNKSDCNDSNDSGFNNVLGFTILCILINRGRLSD